MSVAAKTREHNERDEGAQVPRWKSREPVCQRYFNETVRFQSEKREEGIQETTRDCGGRK